MSNKCIVKICVLFFFEKERKKKISIGSSSIDNLNMKILKFFTSFEGFW